MAPLRGLNKAKGLGSLIPQATQYTKSNSSEEINVSEEKKAEETKGTAQAETPKKKAPAKKTTAKPATKVSEAKSPEKKSPAKASEVKSTPKKSVEKVAVQDKPATKLSEEKLPEKKSPSKTTDTYTRVEKDELVENRPVELRISQVFPNKEQPRTSFEEEKLAELADSITRFGILQPLLVQKKGNHYEIISGERRWRAAKYAGLKKVPVIIKDYEDHESLEIALIENIQREDLNIIEEAKAYQRFIDEFHYTQEEIANRVSKSRSAVANALRLLGLNAEIQKLLVDGSISMGHARALLGLSDPVLQGSAASEIMTKQLNVRETERLVKRLNAGKTSGSRSAGRPSIDPQLSAVLLDLSNRLTERIGTKVSIKTEKEDRGKIEIEYYSKDDLERIINLIQSHGFDRGDVE